MKTLFIAALTLSLTTSAIAAAPAAKGTKVVSCSASDGDYVELSVYHNPDGSYRASVTEESFGGSYPTFHYDVRKAQDAEGNDEYVGQKFSLKLKADRQARLVIDGNANEMDCR